MAVLSLGQEVLLTVFDKLALGGVLVGVGFWLNRKLEIFKAERALNIERAKRRVDAAGAISDLVADYEAACLDEGRQLASLIHRELLAAGISGLPTFLPPGTAAALRAIQPFQRAQLPQGAEQRIAEEIRPVTVAVIDQAARLMLAIRKAEFWIGGELADAFAQYVSEYSRAFADLEPNVGSWEVFLEKRAALQSLRPRATALMAAE